MNKEITFEPALETARASALRFLESLGGAHVNATVDTATLRARFVKPLPETPVDSERVIEELVRDVEGGLLGMPGGRFFAWVIGGALPSALAADWLTSAWDQNAAIYACSPAAAIVEEAAGAWLKELLNVPASASFALVTGCQMAHVTCLAAARHALYARIGWDVERRGLYGAPPVNIISSANRHASIDRAVRFLGIGTDNIHYVAPGAGETLDAGALEAALRNTEGRPAIVLLQAGDINTGAFDSFERLIPVAKRYGAWVHVDGAFGMWAAASPQYRHLVGGMESADSWATDGHKWLNVPFDCGYAFVADAAAHRASMTVRAPYISDHAEARDQIDWNPEWSRRARGFSTYAALRELGRAGVADLIERTCAFATQIVDGVAGFPGAEVLWRPIINQGLVRFKSSRADATEVDHDQRTDDVIARITASGEAFFGPTTWQGQRAMRVSVLNWQTSERDVERAIAAIGAACSID